MSESIRGYRIVGDVKQDRQLSLNYLLLKPEASHALDKLRRKVDEEERKKDQGRGKGIPCVANPEGFSGDNLISERDAQLACSGCPALKLCRTYADVARPAHGVYGGRVKNMEIPND